MQMRVSKTISSAASTREIEGAKRENIQAIKAWLLMRVEDASAEVFADGTIEHRVVNTPPHVHARLGHAARVNTTWRKVTGGKPT